MKLEKQPKPMCLLYAAAMVLGVKPAILLDEIGHDGLEVWWPTHTGNSQYRGHHIQEIIDCFLRRGFSLTCIEPEPVCAPDHFVDPRNCFLKSEAIGRVYRYLEQYSGILISGTHAVAWDTKQVYDPNGSIYSIDKFKPIREIWFKT